MTMIWQKAALLASVGTFGACAGGIVKSRATTTEAVVTTPAPASREIAQTMARAAVKEKEKMVMDENEIVNFDVYRRGGRYYVTVGMQGDITEGAALLDVVSIEPEVESIAAALRQLEPRIREAFAAAQRGERQLDNDDIDKVYWERMGAKSNRQFMRSTSIVACQRYRDKIEIWYMLHNPQWNLFTGSGEEPDAKLPPDASYEDIARAVLEIFAKSPPPPGDKPAAPKRARKTTGAEH